VEDDAVNGQCRSVLDDDDVVDDVVVDDDVVE
jgi:hypothetical protein